MQNSDAYCPIAAKDNRYPMAAGDDCGAPVGVGVASSELSSQRPILLQPDGLTRITFGWNESV